MPVISLFSGSYCNEKPVIQEIRDRTGYRLVMDREIVADASRLSNIPENRIERVFSDKTSVFNRLTRERERSLYIFGWPWPKKLSEDDLVISGFAGQLIPRNIKHVLRVCLIADMNSRIAVAAAERHIAPAEALKIIHREDETCAEWIYLLFGTKDPLIPPFMTSPFRPTRHRRMELRQRLKKASTLPLSNSPVDPERLSMISISPPTWKSLWQKKAIVWESTFGQAPSH